MRILKTVMCLGFLSLSSVWQNSYATSQSAAEFKTTPSVSTPVQVTGSSTAQPANTKTSSQATDTSKDQMSNVSLLFAISAKSALLEKLGNRGYYTLTLYDVNPYLTYFSERPERDSGVAPVQNFVKAWDVGNNSFQSVNPNAVLIAATIDAVTNQNGTFYLMTCSTPSYNTEKSVLTFVIKPLPKAHLIFDHMKFGGTVLVIDSIRKTEGKKMVNSE